MRRLIVVYFNSLLAPNGKIALMGFWDRFRKKEEKEVLWTKCESCKSLLYIPELKKNLNVCPKCQHHFNMPAKDRLEYLLQDYQILFDEIRPTDPLNFKDTKGYRERLKQAQESTGLSEAMLVAEGLLKDERIVLGWSLRKRREILWTLPFGSLPRLESLLGILHGGQEGLVGTLSASP